MVEAQDIPTIDKNDRVLGHGAALNLYFYALCGEPDYVVRLLIKALDNDAEKKRTKGALG